MRVISCGAVLCSILVACATGQRAGMDAASPEVFSQRVGAAGGTVALPDGATVTIPAGALSTAVTITVSRYPASRLPPFPMGYVAAGDAYAFEPHGLPFARPVVISVPFTGDATGVDLARLDDDVDTSWEVATPVTVVGSRLEHLANTFSIDRPRRESGVITLPFDASMDSAADATSDLDAGVIVVTDARVDDAGVADADASDGAAAMMDAAMLVDSGIADAAVDASAPVTVSVLEAYIKQSNTGGADTFGYTIALSGNTLVVGAPYEASNATGIDGDQLNNGAVASGAAYVFVRSGGVWTQQAYLKGSDTAASDNFGFHVAIDSNTIVVGARNSRTTGAAYVFVRNGVSWSEQARLTGSNTEVGDWFGYNVAISGDTIVVGADGESSIATTVGGDETDNSAPSSGAAYVFVRSGGTWSQQAYLKADNADEGDYFGWSVGVSGDTAVVGAWGESSNAIGVNGYRAGNTMGDAGAAYVFTRSGTTWSQQAYLKASRPGSNDNFGTTVAIAGDTVAVGAVGEASNAIGLNGDDSDNSAGGSGAAYVFVRTGSQWSQQAYFKASNATVGDYFGSRVALSGDTLVVAATGEDSNAVGVGGDQANNSVSSSGAVYVFTRTESTWVQDGYLKASNPEPGDELGSSVAVSGGTVAAAACYEDSAAIGIGGDQADNSARGSGAVYVFR